MEVHDFSPSGGNGNPAAVDVNKGAEVVQRVVSMAVDYVKAFLKLRTTKRP
jgi:creatinine amidohydrolase/Fe(II)-dependent formamide hydrolase-like protein